MESLDACLVTEGSVEGNGLEWRSMQGEEKGFDFVLLILSLP